jgi:hypothetical protein
LFDYVCSISEKDDFCLVVKAFLQNPFSVAEMFPSPKIAIIMSAKEWQLNSLKITACNTSGCSTSLTSSA